MPRLGLALRSVFFASACVPLVPTPPAPIRANGPTKRRPVRQAGIRGDVIYGRVICPLNPAPSLSFFSSTRTCFRGALAYFDISGGRRSLHWYCGAPGQPNRGDKIPPTRFFERFLWSCVNSTFNHGALCEFSLSKWIYSATPYLTIMNQYARLAASRSYHIYSSV